MHTFTPGPWLTIDGFEHPDPESNLAGDGQHAPFAIFNPEAQNYLRTDFPTREAASLYAASLHIKAAAALGLDLATALEAAKVALASIAEWAVSRDGTPEADAEALREIDTLAQEARANAAAAAVLTQIEVTADALSLADRFPVEDWRYEVSNGDTKLGYDEWVKHRAACEDAEQENKTATQTPETTP